MTALTWGDVTHPYEAGVDKAVLYLPTGSVAWNGIISVLEKPDAPLGSDVYLDGVKYLSPQTVGDFALTVQAFTYPDEFSDFAGYADLQPTQAFGFSYRTHYDVGYKIHLVYNVTASPSELLWKTEGSNVENSTFSWEFATKPEFYPGLRSTAHFTIDSTEVRADVLAAIEDILYGTDTTDAMLIRFRDIVELYLTMTQLRIFDNGDGTWIAIGPDDAITMLDDTTFQIDWPTAVFVDSDSYTLSDG